MLYKLNNILILIVSLKDYLEEHTYSAQFTLCTHCTHLRSYLKVNEKFDLLHLTLSHSNVCDMNEGQFGEMYPLFT